MCMSTGSLLQAAERSSSSSAPPRFIPDLSSVWLLLPEGTSLLAVLTLHTTGMKGQGPAGYSVDSLSISRQQGEHKKEMEGVSQVWMFDI